MEKLVEIPKKIIADISLQDLQASNLVGPTRENPL